MTRWDDSVDRMAGECDSCRERNAVRARLGLPSVKVTCPCALFWRLVEL